MGSGSTPGHKPRSPVGRRAVCTERHQRGGGGWLRRVQGPGPGSTVERVLPEHCCSYGSQPGRLLGPFWLLSTATKQAGAKKHFFVKKMDIWHIRAPDGPKSGPIFFSRRTKILPAAKGPKKGPKSGRLGFRSKIGRLGASEPRNPKFTTPQIW